MLIHKRINDLIYGVKRYIFCKSGLGIAISITNIIQAIVLGRIISQVFYSESLFSMQNNIILLLIVLSVRIALVWFNQLYGKWIVSRVKNKLRERAIQKLADLGPGYMTHHRTGQIESTIVAGIDYLEGYLTLYIPQILVCFVGCGIMVAFVFSIHYVLGLIVLTTLLLALISPGLFINTLSKFSEDHWQAYMDLNAEFVDTTQGMITLKAFGAAQRIGLRLKHKMHVLFQKTMLNLRFNLAEVGIVGFAGSFGSAFTLGLAAYYTVTGTISLTQLSTLLFLTSEVYRPVSELGLYFHQGFMGMTSTDGLMELFDADISIENKADAEIPHCAKVTPPSIFFQSIQFRYPKASQNVLNELTLQVHPGEKLAIVGESGSGKTTLINLLMRFYDPTKGQIHYNGIDTRALPLSFLRKQIAVVSQDTYLFNGTLADNLRLAKEQADDAELKKVCQAAQIHDYIMTLPNGYETIVGERGLNLSGGQRQRVSIARALLKDAPVIILDEATSSVDLENERAIQKSLAFLLQNKTSITIAHRLSTIRNADRILVLQQGRIAEEGNHQELMDRKLLYYRLVLAQQEGL